MPWASGMGPRHRHHDRESRRSRSATKVARPELSTMASNRNGTVPAPTRRPMLIVIGVLIGIVITFYGIRLATDLPFLITGTDPDPEDFESRYVAHHWLAYLHMTPGVLYLLGAPCSCRNGFGPSTTHSTADWAGCWWARRCSASPLHWCSAFSLPGADLWRRRPPSSLDAGSSSASCAPCARSVEGT